MASILSSVYGIKSDQAQNGKVSIDKVQTQNKKTCCEGYQLILMD